MAIGPSGTSGITTIGGRPRPGRNLVSPQTNTPQGMARFQQTRSDIQTALAKGQTGVVSGISRQLATPPPQSRTYTASTTVNVSNAPSQAVGGGTNPQNVIQPTTQPNTTIQKTPVFQPNTLTNQSIGYLTTPTQPGTREQLLATPLSKVVEGQPIRPVTQIDTTIPDSYKRQLTSSSMPIVTKATVEQSPYYKKPYFFTSPEELIEASQNIKQQGIKEISEGNLLTGIPKTSFGITGSFIGSGTRSTMTAIEHPLITTTMLIPPIGAYYGYESLAQSIKQKEPIEQIAGGFAPSLAVPFATDLLLTGAKYLPRNQFLESMTTPDYPIGYTERVITYPKTSGTQTTLGAGPKFFEKYGLSEIEKSNPIKNDRGQTIGYRTLSQDPTTGEYKIIITDEKGGFVAEAQFKPKPDKSLSMFDNKKGSLTLSGERIQEILEKAKEYNKNVFGRAETILEYPTDIINPKYPNIPLIINPRAVITGQEKFISDIGRLTQRPISPTVNFIESKQEQEQEQAQKIKQEAEQERDILPIYYPTLILGSRAVASQIIGPGQAQSQDQKQEQIPIQETVQQQNFVGGGGAGESLRGPPPPPMLGRTKPFGSPPKKKKKSGGGTAGYNVFVRKKGRDILVGENLPVGKALTVGSGKVRTSLSVTFKVAPTGKTTFEKDVFGPDLSQFRQYTYRRGRPVFTPGTYIQQRRYRLSNPLEVREIQSSRKKGLGGWL